MPQKFFITHSWKDMGFARRLFDDLQANGQEGFLDEKTIKGGHRLAEEINRGLEWCDVYIPVLSRHSLQSPWCWEEINAAIALSNQRGRQGRPTIMSVVIDDCEVPALLSSRLYFTFTDRYAEALNELLTKGFGVSGPGARPSSLPERRKQKTQWNWIALIGVLVVMVIAVCSFAGYLGMNMLNKQTPVPTPVVGQQVPVPALAVDQLQLAKPYEWKSYQRIEANRSWQVRATTTRPAKVVAVYVEMQNDADATIYAFVEPDCKSSTPIGFQTVNRSTDRHPVTIHATTNRVGVNGTFCISFQITSNSDISISKNQYGDLLVTVDLLPD